MCFELVCVFMCWPRAIYTPCNGLYRDAPPTEGYLFGLQVWEKGPLFRLEACKRGTCSG